MLALSERRRCICFVTSSYPRFEQDGNAHFTRSIAEAQAALGHQVHVLAPYASQVRMYDSPVQLHWFRYIVPSQWGVMGHAAALENDRQLQSRVLWQTPLFGLIMALEIQKLIYRQKVDLIHAHWVIPSGFVAGWLALLNHKPLFISLHGSDMYLACRNAVFRSMARWALRQAQAITACSQSLADSAIRMGAPPGRVHVVPYGADPVRFDPQTSSAKLRRQLDLPLDALIILAAGRLVGKKGLDQLIRAMPSVLTTVSAARLIILGEGPERGSLERLCTKLNMNAQVSLPGAVPWTTVANYLVASDVFVMPSVRDVTGNLDGLPNVILEAMAAARPVVATRIAGIPLAVLDNVTGILVEEATPDQLSAALIRLLTLPAERVTMGLAGRMRIESELNWNRFAMRLDQIYQRALENYDET